MRAASMPAASAISSASAITAWVQPTISWLIILATRPLPDRPHVREAGGDDRAISGATRAMSAAVPPAITVSVPVPEAGGPPETGASTQPQPVASCEPRGVRAPLVRP